MTMEIGCVQVTGEMHRELRRVFFNDYILKTIFLPLKNNCGSYFVIQWTPLCSGDKVHSRAVSVEPLYDPCSIVSSRSFSELLHCPVEPGNVQTLRLDRCVQMQVLKKSGQARYLPTEVIVMYKMRKSYSSCGILYIVYVCCSHNLETCGGM